MDKIVICLIHGDALGSRLQLAAACNIRVSTPAAFEGPIPHPGILRLARHVGMGCAKRLIFLGRRIDDMKATSYRLG